MELNGLELDIDLTVILEACGMSDYQDRGTDLRAHCPAHVERTPSWDISKETGEHNCFGCGYKGNVVKLLVDYHPEIENSFQAMRWLFEEFNISPERKPLDIEKFLQRGEPEEFLPEELLDKYDFRHPYLYERGFRERTLQAFRVGWCAEEEYLDNKERKVHITRAITIPWRDRRGRFRFLKYRPLDGIRYINRGEPGVRKRILFGLDKVIKKGTSRVALCEGELDAMYCWQAGIPAVAAGGAFISREQVKELLYAGIKRVDVFLDNPVIDKAGKDGREHAKRLLAPYVKLFDVVFPREVKDANDWTEEELHSIQYTFL